MTLEAKTYDYTGLIPMNEPVREGVAYRRPKRQPILRDRYQVKREERQLQRRLTLVRRQNRVLLEAEANGLSAHVAGSKIEIWTGGWLATVRSFSTPAEALAYVRGWVDSRS